ncbi:hypothetical protein MHU86_15406 [Fragilaria crotonensis]|nr:hypothetical protein MHU86_15406 [Fragilaria crotonensis]
MPQNEQANDPLSSNTIEDMNERDDDDSLMDYDGDSFDSEDENYDSDEDLDDAFTLYMEAACGGNRVIETKKSSAELWTEFLADQDSKVLKLTDEFVEKFELRDSTTANQVIQAVNGNRGLTHVILGHQFLQLVDQDRLFDAISTHHASTLTYLKLTPEFGGSRLHVEALLATLAKASHLTELELHNLILQHTEGEVEALAELLKAGSLRQIYIFGVGVEGMESMENMGKLDSILQALSTLEPLDELRLEGLGSPAVGSLVSISALQELLLRKQKWWRLGLDNMGLSDDHCFVIADMFARNENCRAGDLLSLKSNPAVTQMGYQRMFTVFYRRGRMGLVKVDDQLWEAEFDLVRSMNNLHGRLEVIVDGMITSREDWVDWASKIGASSTWEADSKKLNYIWFALREHPGIVEQD